jgi:hypothetical protein
MMLLFMKFEDLFREARHPLWIRVYEHPERQLRRQRRVALVVAAMGSEDDKALELFAEVFEEIRLGAMACIFWEDLQETESDMKPKGDTDENSMDQCSVM